MIKIHKKEHIDVLNIHTFTYNIISLFIIRVLLKIPILMKVPIDFSSHLRDIYLSEQQRLKSKIINYSWLKFFKIFVLKKINFVRILNKNIYKDLIELKYPMDCILEIPNGINIEYFKNIKKSKHEVTNYGYVGRLTEFKNLRFLLNVFKEYFSLYTSDKLFIYGRGSESKYIEDFIKSNGLNNNITYCGFEKNKLIIYSKLDVIVDPALAQGISNTNLEAMCSNTFVIASNVEGNKDLIKHRKNGLLFDPFKKSELLKQLKFYKENKELTSQMLENAKINILENYNIEVVANKIFNYLKTRLKL